MAKHTPPGDSGFSTSLARHLGAAVALVVVVAAGFWGIGQLQDDSSPEITAAPTTTPDVTATSEPVATDPATPPATAGATTPPATPGTDEPTPTPTAGATTEPAATPTEDDAPDAEATEDEEVAGDRGDVDPADISIQVLDAAGDDGAAAERVAEQLEDDGFDVVATNKAVRTYDVTTVFYTPGNEAKAEQVAAMYGYDEVAPEPGNLSHTVDVHLVVGSDA